MPLTLADVLRLGGVDPTRVMVLRHKLDRIDLLGLWRTDRPRVEAFQAQQVDDFYANATHCVALLLDRRGREVFAGLYAVEGGYTELADAAESAYAALHDLRRQIPQHDPDKHYVRWSLTHVPEFAEWEDRLVVQWHSGGKSPGWWRWAGRNSMRVLEIADQAPPPFPGWLQFSSAVDILHSLPSSWLEVLRSTSGVYLLTDAVGRHYVGSAKGGDGFLGRWGAYRDGRAGGNVGLKDAKGPFTVAVLQTFDPNTPDQTVEQVESLWKNKLGARLLGYNRN